jgi:hypothetical protein
MAFIVPHSQSPPLSVPHSPALFVSLSHVYRTPLILTRKVSKHN